MLTRITIAESILTVFEKQQKKLNHIELYAYIYAYMCIYNVFAYTYIYIYIYV
jgi:hypothetical protein